MSKKLLLLLVFFFSILTYSQQKEHPMAIGLHYGSGEEFKNTDYTYSNHYFKLQLYRQLGTARYFQYQLLVQPEINFARHRLKNMYFVTPDEVDYEHKREDYTRLKDIREYVLNIGFIVRKPLSDRCSIYVLGSVGPMITDAATERLSKGFAFSDVFAIGLTVGTPKIAFDFRPNVRHVSNAGLQSSNAGFNTFNIEFGFSIPL